MFFFGPDLDRDLDLDLDLHLDLELLFSHRFRARPKIPIDQNLTFAQQTSRAEICESPTL